MVFGRATAVTSEGAKRGIAHARPFPTDTPQSRFPYAGAWTKGLAKVLMEAVSGEKAKRPDVNMVYHRIGLSQD